MEQRRLRRFIPLCRGSFAAARETFPRDAHVEESLSNDLFQRLHDDEIDIAFYRSAPADEAGLELNQLYEPMIMAVPKGNPLTKWVTIIPLRAFADETFIVYGRRLDRG